MPYLIMNKGFNGHAIYTFDASVDIGRGEQNDIVLNDIDDSAISRHHATVCFQAGDYMLKDSSRNGTLVNNEPVSEYCLVHGATFQIGDYFFTFIDQFSTADDAEKIVWRRHQGADEDEFTEFDDKATLTLKRTEDDVQLKRELAAGGIVAESDKMLSLYQEVKTVAAIDVPVLILGEPGTGKEKIAHALYRFSKVKGAFVALNCSSIPEGLFESELFGSVKGAFNNAVNKPGKLELADNGILFLDEVGDMQLALQPKLLRFLEDKKVTRLGDNAARKVNTRIIAATNQDLKQMMGSGDFRKDFFQRLACIQLRVPPLRERREDVLPLTEFFLAKFSKEHNLTVKRVTDTAKKKLLQYSWPGNVRELGNALLAAAVKGRGGNIMAENLPIDSESNGGAPGQGEAFPSIQDMEKKHIIDALERSGGNKVDACKLLGISRDTLYKKIKKYHIGSDHKA